MANRKQDILNRRQLFSPSKTKRDIEYFDASKTVLSDREDTNIDSTSSFRYDPPGAGIKSTQQLNIDYSKFENHTFFNSARVKVNETFVNIINKYPFDGTRKEVEAFFDGLTGFEKHVYDTIPKNVGFIHLVGSSIAETTPDKGTYISVNDYAGSAFPTLSKKNTAEKIIDPESSKSLTAEFHLFVPPQANETQIVFQKLSGSNGITLALSRSASTSLCEIHFIATSGSAGLIATASIEKNKFNHIVTTLDRSTQEHSLLIYVDETKAGESSKFKLDDFSFAASPFLIGSGTTHTLPSSISSLSKIVPAQTLSGALDEFRVFHDIRTQVQQKKFGRKSLYSSDALRLYFRFNEPASASYFDPDASLKQTSKTVLDYSGNSLHSVIENYSNVVRLTGSLGLQTPMTSELLEFSPVLFPTYKKVRDYNIDLLTSASRYDEQNLNLITRLVPKHFFIEEQAALQLDDENGEIVLPMQSGSYSLPGDTKMGQSFVIASLLYTWAKFFDEIKMHIDAFSTLKTVEYDSIDEGMPDQFLYQLFKSYGLDVPNLFTNSSIDQYLDGSDVQVGYGHAADSLQFVQNSVWRRVLTNVNEIIKSKGTADSIKMFIRTLGVEPDATFKIKEYGGTSAKEINDTRIAKSDVSTMLLLSGTLKPKITSLFLSSSRVEPGYPEIVGPAILKTDEWQHGTSSYSSDGLMTSGSWSFEGLYKLKNSQVLTQSLVRMYTTASTRGYGNTDPLSLGGDALFPGMDQRFCVLNLVFIKPPPDSSDKKRLELFGNHFISSDLFNKIVISDVEIDDGDKWNISFGVTRNDDATLSITSSYANSSSLYLRVGKQVGNRALKVLSASTYFPSLYNGTVTSFRKANDTINDLGHFFVVGSESLPRTDALYDKLIINNADGATNAVDEFYRSTNFDGYVGHLKFWSKNITNNEWNEHVKNFRSLGVQDALSNFNFVKNESGSFGRLRLDVQTEQQVTASDSSGEILLQDFSQNNLVFSGSNFDTNTSFIFANSFNYSYLSLKFDENITSDKVRVNSFEYDKHIEEFGTARAPVYDLQRGFDFREDPRFSIDFSIADPLDEDISKIFATLDIIENIIGDPRALYTREYKDIIALREIYFNRLTDKINLMGFYDFFRWFDNAIGVLIMQLLPKSTRFLGTNFIIESHALERNKVVYHMSDVYKQRKYRSDRSIKEAEQISSNILDAVDRNFLNSSRSGQIADATKTIQNISLRKF